MPGPVVGRDAERASIRDFVASISDGAAALVLEGEAGMGKTTLWNAALDDAQALELLVLRARPSESEAALSFSAVGDILDPALDDALSGLVPAQRRALARALVLEEDDGPAPAARAVAVAVLSALRALATDTPLLVAIDDVQWLDSASAGALSYAARRLTVEPIVFLIARRTTLRSQLVSELRRSAPPLRLEEVELGPLAPPELHEVVRHHLGTTLPRPLLLEVHQAAGGNPFFALEIVRMLQRAGVSVEAGHPLPLPESLRELVHGRLLALPAASRGFLLAAAAHAHPTVQITEVASGVSREAGLTPALEARVVELDRDRVRFTHPLLAAGAYAIADTVRRSEVHRRLAELLDDPEARAWQLAASVGEPDEETAQALEEAAHHARARGAPRPAALLLERAGELTPADRPDDAHRRAADAAYLHFESGDSPRAAEQLRSLIAGLQPGHARARALVRLARVRSYENQRDAAELFAEALEEAHDDKTILAVAHEGLAACLFRLRERLADAVEHSDLAARLALELGDDGLAAEALGTQVLAEAILGRPTARDTARRALELQPAASERRVIGQPMFALAVYWWWINDVGAALDAGRELVERCRDIGDESSLPYLLVVLGQGECFAGLLSAAHGHALEGEALAEQSGQHTTLVYCRALRALTEAYLGRGESARVTALQALGAVDETGGRPAELVARSALAHLELAQGHPGAAVEWLAPIVAHARAEAFQEPSAMWFVPDHMEALVECGRPDEARSIWEWYEGSARRLGRPAAVANCLRCRGLESAQEGDLDAALAAFTDGLEWHSRVELPLDRGRTLLALGMTLRRAKRRREARETLSEALAVFERIGAALWAERARGELRRISGRAPAAGALTPAEERVATLVAEGKTNREVATALYLSERTVEGHLSHVFGKLGVRSRTELARVLAGSGQGVGGSNTGGFPVSGDRIAP